MGKFKRLGDAELEIMMIIWKADKPVLTSYIQEHLQGRRNWATSTLMTTLTRLIEKGFLQCDRSGRNNLYGAVIGEEDYKAQESSSFLEKLHGNSLNSFITTLHSKQSLDPEEVLKLRKFLDSLDEEQ